MREREGREREMKGLMVMDLGKARGSSSAKGVDCGGYLRLEDLVGRDAGVFALTDGEDRVGDELPKW